MSKYQVSIESWNRPGSFEKIKETKGWLREDSSVVSRRLHFCGSIYPVGATVGWCWEITEILRVILPLLLPLSSRSNASLILY
jgi:hypothetical protein